MRKCQLPGCKESFEPQSVNQKYCGRQSDKGSCSYRANLVSMRKCNIARRGKKKKPISVERYEASIRAAFDAWQA